MSEANTFEPRILAYVCNWCTYLGADLAGTTRLEYPPNVRIVRLPCTGRIDFNLLIKAFEVGADAVVVSGCHPGDCHYTAGNYHARRRWILFRELLNVLGFDLRRIHFAWISAAEGRKWQETIADITEKTRALGPYTDPCAVNEPVPVTTEALPRQELKSFAGETELRQACYRLLSDGTVKAVVGYGERGPIVIRRPEQADKLVWNNRCRANLTTYLKRKEIRALGKVTVIVKGCDERALVMLEKESQIERGGLHVIGMSCEGMGQAKCDACDTPAARFADAVIGRTDRQASRDAGPRWNDVAALLSKTRSERLRYWKAEFERCSKCYACRQVCPMCYCERCLVEKNRPIAIDPAPSAKGNFAWHVARAFHLAGRCIGCDECTRACPAGIDLRSLNLALAKAAEEHFGYRAGMDPAADPLIGSYSLQDKEDFIR